MPPPTFFYPLPQPPPARGGGGTHSTLAGESVGDSPAVGGNARGVAGGSLAVGGYGEEGSDDGVFPMDEVGRANFCMKHAQFFRQL
jgi:hypothetical protein